MNRSFLAAAALAAPLLAFAAPSPAMAAKSPAMEACSAAWAKLKEDGKLPKGQKWPDFWSKCNTEYKAQNNITSADDELPPEPKVKKKKAAKKAKAKKVAAVEDSVNEDDAPATGTGKQKTACDGKWKDHKASTGAHGWKPYFVFMADCM